MKRQRCYPQRTLYLSTQHGDNPYILWFNCYRTQCFVHSLGWAVDSDHVFSLLFGIRNFARGQNMKKLLLATALASSLAGASYADGMADPMIEAPVITAAAESSSLSAGAVMAMLTISILWAALDD